MTKSACMDRQSSCALLVAKYVELHCSVIAYRAAGAVHVFLKASMPKRKTARRVRPFGMLASWSPRLPCVLLSFGWLGYLPA
jgi:hypothetical protein